MGVVWDCRGHGVFFSNTSTQYLSILKYEVIAKGKLITSFIDLNLV